MDLDWRHVAISGALSFFAGMLLERALHRCPSPPEVRAKAAATSASTTAKATSSTTTKAKAKVTTRWFQAPPPGCPKAAPVVIRERVEERGPVVATTRTETARASTSERRSEVQVIPPPPSPAPGWAISAGLQLVPERKPVLGVGRHLAGPFWIEGWVAPQLELRAPAAGVGLRVQW